MAAANDAILICTDSDEGRVYEYNTKDDTTKMVVQGLKRPSFISVDHTPLSTRYILTLDRQSVKIYNESWNLLTTITQGMKDPWDTAPCLQDFFWLSMAVIR